MEERFWSKVDKSGDCWLWTDHLTPSGYGGFWDGTRSARAHRVSWILTNGAIPEGQIVRHKCRNKCVNPTHLELGTNLDNTKDMIRDGTDHHKLTGAKILEIRRRSGEKFAVTKLAKEFGVCHQLISDIIHKKRWAHIV
jgi:hypothetical protein